MNARNLENLKQIGPTRHSRDSEHCVQVLCRPKPMWVFDNPTQGEEARRHIKMVVCLVELAIVDNKPLQETEYSVLCADGSRWMHCESLILQVGGANNCFDPTDAGLILDPNNKDGFKLPRGVDPEQRSWHIVNAVALSKWLDKNW